MKFFLFIFFISSLNTHAFIHLGPYLQQTTSSSTLIKIEVSEENLSLKVWGPDKNEKRVLPTKKVKVKDGLILFTFELKNLNSNSNYFYQFSHFDHTYTFQTLSDQKEDFSFLIASDAQRGYQVTTKNVRESIFPRFKNSSIPIRFILFAGDLVQNGDSYEEWEQQFFTPMAPLLSELSLFPAIGNHEKNHKHYFTYFDLPANGLSLYEGHWYTFDYQRVRFISLDTNKNYMIVSQLNWLEHILQQTQLNPDIDFVVAFFHHPFQSELWVRGNNWFSGKIQSLLEKFSAQSNIPSVSIFGHTHGYSRGHSSFSRHTMLNVGSIGGGLDHWGEHIQKDYPDYVRSESSFGHNKITYRGGDNPSLILERFSFGNEKEQKDKGLLDRWVIRKNNTPPLSPGSLSFKKAILFDEKSTLALLVEGENFFDPENDFHMSTEVQVSFESDFSTLIGSDITHYQNYFQGIDQNQFSNLQRRSLTLPGNIVNFHQNFYLRMRYRDSGGNWSPYSETLTVLPSSIVER